MNSDICIVTSFNQKLYEKYAYQFINSYLEQKINIDLYIYSEDDKNNFKCNNNKIKVIQLLHNFPSIKKFYNNNNNYQLKKYIECPEKYKWKYDAIRFSYKIFSIIHNFNNYPNYKYILWIDADTLFLKKFNYKLIYKLIKENNMISFLGRSKLEGHSECGFLIFNRNHKYMKEYFNEILHLYLSKNIYNEKEWHDSYIWDLIRKKYEEKYNIKNFNISKYFYRHLKNKNINKDIFMAKNIMLKIPLNKYFLHLKGKINKEQKKIISQNDNNNYLYSIEI